MISLKHKFIFVHIPKCAGCSLKEHLKEHSKDELINSHHLTLQKIIKNFNIEAADYYKFTFVRNPWNRILSLYSFWLNQTPSSIYYQWDYEQVDFIKSENISFRDFVKLAASNDTVFHKKPHLNPYIGHFIKHPSSLDFIGKLENFQEDFNVVCERIGIPKQQPRWVNKSKHKHYTEYYDDETIQIIAEKYAKDIEYFGYEFGE